MSAVLALAEPRRIKASHRRRRKVTSGPIVQRYYDPQIGRFLSVDPMEMDAFTGWNFNRYSYAAANPYKFTDLDGRVIGRAVKETAEYAARKLLRRTIENAGRRAVNAAWKMERQLVAKTGKGTRDWSSAEKKELLGKGKVGGYDGHHMNTKGNDLGLAGNPDNVEFLDRSAHIETHAVAGGTRVEISGRPLVDRTDGGSLPRVADSNGYALSRQATSMAMGALSATAIVGEVMDYTDPLTYMFYINDAK